MSQKILVSGDVCGNFDHLYKRVTAVNKKNPSGPFDLLLCVGEFFGNSLTEWEPYKDGKIKVPISTYVLGPTDNRNSQFYHHRKGCELAENVIYLGSYGIYPCSSGLKIAYLSGIDGSNKASMSNTSFSVGDLEALETAAGNKPKIDILITSEWPKGIFEYAKVPNGIDPNETGSFLISRLAYRLKPRYHFVGGKNIYHERLPYRNHIVLKEAALHVTRFISLAKVNDPSKQKWLYAFNVSPISVLDPNELVKQPPDVTECPYSEKILRLASNMSKKASSNVNQFFYDTCEIIEERSNKRKQNSDGGQRKKGPPKPTGPCWFCLASPDVEKHLVVSVGEFSYLALAKGGLVPDHLLILPIEHFQSTSDIKQECLKEIEQYKVALKRMHEKAGKVVVFFERNYRTQHMQIQAVPLQSETMPYIKESFLDIGENCNVPLISVPPHGSMTDMIPPGAPFFSVELPDGERWFHRIHKHFPLQFGREVLACPALLNLPHRVDWRECKSSVEEETSMRNEVKKAFHTFDFTLSAGDDDADSDDSEDE